MLKKLFPGRISWWEVIIFAVFTALMTAAFLISPIFENTSFQRMGVYLEAWIFFAVLIMANCQKPLESALKTFVFFLVSQPLIYLFQVPFSAMGWGLFGYYRTWFIWTLFTFPMAFVGWYITKKNWLSLLILSPVLVFLAYTALDAARFTASHFPRQLVTALFCLGQIVLYLWAFTSKPLQKLLGLAVPLALAAVVLLSRTAGVEVDCAVFFPNDPVFSENAVVTEDNDSLTLAIDPRDDGAMLRVHATAYGDTDFTVTDGGATYDYTLQIRLDDGGHVTVNVVKR